MGRVQAGWLLEQVIADGHGRGMRRQARSERGTPNKKGAVFLRLPRRACLVLLARFALAFACLKNAKKTTPVIEARFMINVIRSKGFYVTKKFFETLAPNESSVPTLLLFFLERVDQICFEILIAASSFRIIKVFRNFT